MQGAASAMKGRSEWDRQTANLKRLAEVYGATFPLPDGADRPPDERQGDRRRRRRDRARPRIASRTTSTKTRRLPKPEKDAAKKDVEMLIKQADAVKSRTSDGKPATGEVRQLVDQVAKLQTFVGAHPIATMTNWQAVQTSLAKLQQAFGPDAVNSLDAAAGQMKVPTA